METVSTLRRALAFLMLLLTAALHAQPSDGVYTGRTRQGRTFSLTVTGGAVTSYSITYFCSTPGGMIVSSGTTTTNGSCPITNGNFTCGNATCIPAQGVVTSAVEGSFNGTHLSGTFTLSVGGAGFCACGLNPTAYNADLAGTEGTTLFGPGGAGGSGVCSTFARPSQFFSEMSAAAELADDIDVPPAEIYVVQRVWAHGSYGSGAGPADGVDVKFFGDGGGIPGAVACGYTNLPTVSRPDVSDFVVDLPTACRLTSGKWWLSVQARQPLNPKGQWFWAESSATSGLGYQFQDPANVLGTGCTSWGSGAACFEPDPANTNTCVLLKGTLEEGPLFADGFEGP